MTTGKRNIAVKQMPSFSNPRQDLLFLQEVDASLAHRRPCLVLDCSQVRALDDSTIHLMLHILEAALKRNGDVKVAALSPVAGAAFVAARLERLFDTYETTAEAVASFHRARVSGAPSAAALNPMPAVSAA